MPQPGKKTRFRTRGDPNSAFPLIIFFHGSGDSCASWELLADLLSAYHLLIWDRLDPNIKPEYAISELLEHLDGSDLPSEYVLIAHSYGGTFARLCLEARPHQIAGMVLVETGQETGIDPEIEQRQYQGQILENKPLVVIRGNTLKWKQMQYERALAAEQNMLTPTLLIQKQMLDATDKEDERLKKVQLQLSRNNRYVHLPDCGHGVIQARPDAVREAVSWVMEHLYMPEDEPPEEPVQETNGRQEENRTKRSVPARKKKPSLVGKITNLLRKSKGQGSSSKDHP